MKKLAVLTIFVVFFLSIACNKKPAPVQDTAADFASYQEKGLEIAAATQSVMSMQLKQALESGGVPHAVRYCNVAAYPIADSLSKVHGAIIRRVTDKPRNPNNAMNAYEQSVFEQFKSQWGGRQAVAPIVRQLENGEIAVYAPIALQLLCTNCHGTLGETLKTDNYAVVRDLYPADKAVGYAEGDLRGMWAVYFPKSSLQ